MEDIILNINTLFYAFFEALAWILARVVTLIEKSTKAVTALTVLVSRLEKDLSDHEGRIRQIEKETKNELA